MKRFLMELPYVIFYVLGVLVAALGINFLLRSDLGAGAWDTVSYALSQLARISVGTASLTVNVTVLLVVLADRRKLKYLFVLVPILLFGAAIDFWDLLVLASFHPTLLWVRVLLFVTGVFIITLGLAMVVVTTYPAMVYEELTLLLMKRFRIKTFFATRMLIELFALVLAVGIGFLAGIGFGKVNFGSVVLAIFIGPIIHFQIHWLGKVIKRQPILKQPA
jgi:uncharacterized protein